MGDFEVGAEQRLFRNARQGRSDLLLLLRRWRANVQHIYFHLRLGRGSLGSLLRYGGKS